MTGTVYIFAAFVLGILVACFTFAIRRPDGVMEVVEEEEDKIAYRMVLYSDLDNLPKKKELRFKVTTK